MLLIILPLLSLLFWLIVLLLPWQPWRNRYVLEKQVEVQPDHADLSQVTVVIPARNEAGLLPTTLSGLEAQGRSLQVILVDDCSSDGTAEVARQAAGLNLTVVQGQPLPPGWAGKLWALEQGVRRVRTRYALLLDADILLAPGVLEALLRLARAERRALVSVMAALPMERFWENLLTPAFIYFFKMLYPFSLANGASPRFAAAAGGCILLETRLFDQIGGLESIRGALIDDCALAAKVKRAGARIWIGQSRLVTGIRPYTGLRDIWNMVARSAYTQLGYSPILLLLCSLILLILFPIPPLSLFTGRPEAAALGLLAWAAMALSYLPTLIFYRRNPIWALLFPLAGMLYLGMTWSSALRYYRGQRSRWKERTYQR